LVSGVFGRFVEFLVNDDGGNETVDTRTPAITTGMIDFIINSGLRTPILMIPTPDLAVP